MKHRWIHFVTELRDDLYKVRPDRGLWTLANNPTSGPWGIYVWKFYKRKVQEGWEKVSAPAAVFMNTWMVSRARFPTHWHLPYGSTHCKCKDIHLWHETSWDNVKCYNISSWVEDFHVAICIQNAEVLQIYKEEETVTTCMDQKKHEAPQCEACHYNITIQHKWPKPWQNEQTSSSPAEPKSIPPQEAQQFDPAHPHSKLTLPFPASLSWRSCNIWICS